MKNYTNSRGWRNNNPLNIRKSTSKWQGLAAVQTDKAFCQFTSMAYGYRAAIKTLQTYHDRFTKHGRPFTIENIISTWAPASDGNNPDGYAAKVAIWSGIDRQQVLPPPNTQRAVHIFCRIMAAMTRVECGVPDDKIPWEYIAAGYSLAYRNLIVKREEIEL